MSEVKIDCPHCGNSIELSEALAGPVVEAERRKAIAAAEQHLASERTAIEAAVAARIRAEAAARIQALESAATIKDVELQKAHAAELAAIRAKQEADEARRNLNVEVARRVAAEIKAAADRARDEVSQELGAKLQAAESQLVEIEAKRRAAEEAELAARKAKTDAEEAKRQAELAVTRRLDEERLKVREQALKERDEEYSLKAAEKEKALKDLREKLDEAQRKAMADAEQHLTRERSAIEAAVAARVRAEDAARIQALESAAATKEAELQSARAAELAAIQAKQEADEARRNLNVEVTRRVAAEIKAATDRARDEVSQDLGARLQAAESQLADIDAKRRAAEDAELAALKAKTDAEEAKRQAELAVARRLDEERLKVREQALKERDEEYRLKVAEKDKQLNDLREKLDEAQRKADLGSQQLKGDVLELDLYDALSDAFPGDHFERVKKGQKGGDLIHTVRSASGLVCGRIKWESKYTQNWSDGWLPKLREDQRNYKCDLAALMSETLPEGVEHFDVIDDVWVSGIATVVPMAGALRRMLIDTATARRAAAGAGTTKDIAYSYLTGPEFRARVRGIVEPILEMRGTLESEKRAAARHFAMRDKQLERMIGCLAGMYGDLQGIVGSSLPTVEGLALPEPEQPDLAEIAADASAESSEVH